MSNWLKLKRGYRFGETTFYSKHHLGVDIIAPLGTSIYAPSDGVVVNRLNGKEGGLTVWFRPTGKNEIIRFLHLSKFGTDYNVKEGDIIGYVGSTGSLSKGNHAHIDISKNHVDINDFSNFIDPEKYEWSPKIDPPKPPLTPIPDPPVEPTVPQNQAPETITEEKKLWERILEVIINFLKSL